MAMAMGLCFCFVWAHGFFLVSCVPCALMSIVLTPPILLPDYWLFATPLFSLLPSSFAPFIRCVRLHTAPHRSIGESSRLQLGVELKAEKWSRALSAPGSDALACVWILLSQMKWKTCNICQMHRHFRYVFTSNRNTFSILLNTGP